MKPTMPMNAFPPGGPPGTPGGGAPPPGGGGWGPPPGGGGYGGPPPGPPIQFQEPKKSRTGLYLGLGCGCLSLFACAASFGIYMLISSVGPGDEVQSTTATLGQPFTLTYTQDGSQLYEVWAEVDVSYTQGYSLTGNILMSEGGTPFGQYTLSDTGQGSAVQERNSSVRMSWTSTNVNGNGSSSGTVSLFPIPAKTDGSTVTLSGTINGRPGTTGTVRIFVAKRD